MALYITLDEALARLTKREKTPSIAGDKLSRRWEYIDATVADDLVTAVNTTTVVNPQADGQTYTGTFARNTIAGLGQDDRSVTVAEELTLLATIDAAGDLTTLSPEKRWKNEILNNWGINEGELHTVIYTYYNINPASQSYCIDTLTDAQIATALGLAAGSYQDRDFKQQADGTAVFIVITLEPEWSSATWADQKKEMQEQNSNGHRLNKLTEATGLNAAAGDTAYAAAKADTTEATRTVLMAQLIERANGERVVAQSKGELSESTNTDEVVILEIQDPVGRREAAVGRIWWNRSLAAKEALIKPTAPIGVAVTSFTYNSNNYTHTKVEVTDQGNGRYNVFQLAIIPKDTSSGFRGFRDGTVAPFSIRSTVFTDVATGVVSPYFVITDRIVDEDYDTVNDYIAEVADPEGYHPQYLYPLSTMNWDDRNQRWIGLRVTRWVSPPRQTATIDATTPVRTGSIRT